ncbi:hypothetical protein AGABI2DRAFT_140058 [Agaricus bisporus var. bisporus H97]|uniref:hypothetical protein n=1 Tax=Agaricus bisporus var. bisporus (strain H97 / ATCC MYA-4626 / FGSC 10389) TaxID=936046 RepID=UPI00029F5AC3|nr:hypothetical protein AGABI2DRAFT_140058 [Agaricus bisporus var. bisporus H97]EKV50934.1 hypothetical protein AGABI2DRAFT_140058 [Agaricus bisporus var. bisporus H97]
MAQATDLPIELIDLILSFLPPNHAEQVQWRRAAAAIGREDRPEGWNLSDHRCRRCGRVCLAMWDYEEQKAWVIQRWGYWGPRQWAIAGFFVLCPCDALIGNYFGRRCSAKSKKLQIKILGAQRRLGNMENKLRMALDAERPPMDSSITGTVPNPESSAMDVDATPIEMPVTVGDAPGEHSESSTIANSAGTLSLAVDAPSALLAPERGNHQLQPHLMQSFGIRPSDVFPPVFSTPAAPETPSLSLPVPPLGPSLPATTSEDGNITFRGMGLEDDVDMNLVTAEDKAEMQQALFASHFSKPKPPAKAIRKMTGLIGVEYVEVSNSEDTGDSAIFQDDEEGDGKDAKQSGEIGVVERISPTQSGAVRLNPLPDAKNIRGRKEKSGAAVKPEKDRDSGGLITKDKVNRKDDVASSLKEEKNLKGKKREIQDSEDDDDEEDQGDYRASDYLIAKAARVAATLAKRRKRLADPVSHAKFLEDWLNARSAAERPPLPHGINLVRYDPDYLPAVATANYDLTLQILQNQTKNYLCIPHTHLNRKLFSEVDNLQGPIRIWGIPFRRKQNSNSSSKVLRSPDHFHCGCHEKVALAGFIMWKTWKAKAMINGKLVVEGLHQHQAFHPRDVLFILQFLKSKFGYTVEDMFTGSSDDEEASRKEAQVMKKVANFCARRHHELTGQEMTLDTNSSEILEEELTVPQWI